MDLQVYFNDFVYKATNAQSFLYPEDYENPIKITLYLDNDRVCSMKASHWAEEFVKSGLFSKSTQTSSHYEKAEKIITEKTSFRLSLDLDSSDAVYTVGLGDLPTQQTEPKIIAAEHGYDLQTRVHKFSQSLTLRYNHINISNLYSPNLRKIFDGKIYKNK